MKKWLLFLGMSMVMVVLVACTANKDAGEDPKEEPESTEKAEKEEDEKEEEKVLYLNNVIDTTSLDPSIGFDQVSWDPLNNLMEGVTRLDEDSTAQAGVAEDWDVSDDGLTYTFYLRDDANWSTGDAVVAEDFIYAWTLIDRKSVV